MKCVNCEASISSTVSSPAFILDQHVCAACQKDVNTLRIVITRTDEKSPWKVEHYQPLNTTFQVPKNSDSVSVAR